MPRNVQRCRTEPRPRGDLVGPEEIVDDGAGATVRIDDRGRDRGSHRQRDPSTHPYIEYVCSFTVEPTT